MRDAMNRGAGRSFNRRELATHRQSLFRQEPPAIHLGKASGSQLRSHPLVGPALAQKILALRRKRKLNAPEDLLSAGVVSEPQLEKLKRVSRGELPVRPVIEQLEASKKRLHVGEKFNLTLRFVPRALIVPEILKLEIRFPSSRRASALYRLDAASARRGEFTIRGVVSGEAGELFAIAELFDSAGTSSRCSALLGVFTRNPVSMYVWPDFYTQSSGAGAPKYNFAEKRWYCHASVTWVNGTERTVNLGRTVTVRVTDAGASVATFSFSLSSDIIIPAWTTIYGIIHTFHDKTGSVGSRFHNKGDLTFEYEMSGDGHTVRRRQIWRTMLVVGYNVIRIGDFTQAERQEYRRAAAEVASGIFSSRDLSVHDVELYRIEGSPSQDADKQRYRFINDDNEGHQLMAAYSVSNWYFDVFFVEGIWDGSFGFVYGVNNPVDKQGDRSGIVIRRDGDTVNLGQTFAHETGHYLGLEHADEEDGCADTNPVDPDIDDNFIFSSSKRDSDVITACQMLTMRKHGLVRTLTP